MRRASRNRSRGRVHCLPRLKGRDGVGIRACGPRGGACPRPPRLGAAQRLERGLLQLHRLDAHLHQVEAHLQPALDDPELARSCARSRPGRASRTSPPGSGRACRRGIPPTEPAARPARRPARPASESRHRHAERIPHLLHEFGDVVDRRTRFVLLRLGHAPPPRFEPGTPGCAGFTPPRYRTASARLLLHGPGPEPCRTRASRPATATARRHGQRLARVLLR